MYTTDTEPAPARPLSLPLTVAGPGVRDQEKGVSAGLFPLAREKRHGFI